MMWLSIFRDGTSRCERQRPTSIVTSRCPSIVVGATNSHEVKSQQRQGNRTMKYVVALSLGLLTLGASSAGDPPAKGAKTEKPGWKLAWSDEFDGPEIDRKKWDHDVGNGFFNYDANTWISGWGNGELQYYTRDPANAFVKGGMLHIRVLKES